MRACKIYSTEKNIEMDAVFVNNQILLPMEDCKDAEPSHTASDGQCYYPPYYASEFTREMRHWIPFSLVCEWQEFFSSDDEDELQMPYWVYNLIEWKGYDLKDIHISDEKWGYCLARTGEIMLFPQWEHCGDFDDDKCAIIKANGLYGIIEMYAENGRCEEMFDPIYDNLVRLPGGTYLKQIGGKWGALYASYYIHPNDTMTTDAVWDAIWWDGYGAFTVMKKADDGRETYGVLSCSYTGDELLADNLDAMPVRYTPPAYETRINTFRDGAVPDRFRIIRRGDKYGLICDDNNTEQYIDYWSSELLLAPEYSYEHVCKTADKTDMKDEIRYYAWIAWEAVRKTPERADSIWNDIPKDIYNDVRNFMWKDHMRYMQERREHIDKINERIDRINKLQAKRISEGID